MSVDASAPRADPAYSTIAARTGRIARLLTAAAICAAGVVLAVRGPVPASEAVLQIWPPFALVTGLLLIGRVADRDGLFATAGSWLASHAGRRPVVLLGLLLALTALVTAVLNLDTAVVFLTPVVIHAARARAIDERPFLYGLVFMCNSASLLLPGSNLTNLMVFAGAGPPAAAFAGTMLLPWLAAVSITAGVVCLVHRRWLLERPSMAVSRAVPPVRASTGLVAIVAAAGLVLLVRDSALPVLLLGCAAVTLSDHRVRACPHQLVTMFPVELGPLFAIAVALATAGRLVAIPPLITHAGPWLSVGMAAVAAVAVNNLPAAALLVARQHAHPLFLLLGLNLGPNLCITGSLAAVLWLRVARRNGATVSARRYSQLGALVAPLTIGGATLLLMLEQHLR